MQDVEFVDEDEEFEDELGEDELPGEWEERVTVDGSVSFIGLYFTST